jgi:hypothetical protein
MRHVRSGYRHTFTWENRRSTGATIGPVLAIAEVLRVVRAVLSLSLIQPRSRLPVTPLRPAEHYHTYGELELNRKTPWFACKVLVQHDCTHSKRKPCILAVPEGRWWALECYAPIGLTRGARLGEQGGSSRLCATRNCTACRAIVHRRHDCDTIAPQLPYVHERRLCPNIDTCPDIAKRSCPRRLHTYIPMGE